MTQLGLMLRRRESAQATAEYALLLALVAAGLLVALLLFGSSVGQTYGRVANRVNDPGAAQESGAAPGTGTADEAGAAQGTPGQNHGCGGGQGGGYGRGGGGGCGGGKEH